MKRRHAWIAGAGIAGLASALSLARSGWSVSLAERAPTFSEVGAGIQLGPNAVRRLQDWGLASHPLLQAVQPEALHVRRASDGVTLGRLRLSARSQQHYGAPYLTVHRADLHATLLSAVRAQDRVDLRSASPVLASLAGDWQWAAGEPVSTGDLRVVADGVWSGLRAGVVDQGPPTWTGHVAYRALVPVAAMPTAYRAHEVGVWLGPDLHVVHYPVRGTQALNVVVLVEAPALAPSQDWDQAADALGVSRALCTSHSQLRGLVDAVAAAGGTWRMWALAGRARVAGPQDLARGSMVLVGDAAHPMLPYLAQGAGMALEDAQVLADALAGAADVPTGLLGYAQQRWRRVARVQARAQRNGQIFHLQGPMAWARDASLRWGGQAVLDVPWLYSG
jgi:salicylate hydroxylase